MKRLFLMILCGVGLSLNLVVADSMPNLENSNSVSLQQNQTELSHEAIKELEKYDRNLYNIPKTEQEKAELEKLIQAIVNANYDKTKEILDKSPNLVNLNIEPFTTPIDMWFYSFIKYSNDYKAKRVEFDEKMFNLLMSYKPKLYTNDLLPFAITMNENVDDNRTLELLQIMQKDGLDLNIEYPKIFQKIELPIYLITEALATKKFNTMEFLIKNDAKSPVYDGLGFLVNSYLLEFFESNDLKINSSKPLKIEQKNLIKSTKYLGVKNEIFKFIKLYLENNGDIKTLVSIESTFKYLGDTDGLERLKKLGYKELCDSNGKNCNSKK